AFFLENLLMSLTISTTKSGATDNATTIDQSSSLQCHTSSIPKTLFAMTGTKTVTSCNNRQPMKAINKKRFGFNEKVEKFSERTLNAWNNCEIAKTIKVNV